MSFLVKAIGSVVKAVVGIVSKLVGGVIGFLFGSHKAPAAKTPSRLNKTLNPEDFRKIVFGHTACAVDMRFWEVWGNNNTNYDEVLAGASHEINAFKEFYIENELAIDANGTVLGNWPGTVSRLTNLGNAGQAALNVGTGTRWTNAATFDGVAHFALKWVYNETKLPNGIPSRYTQVVEGAKVYDPRRDSTQPGGSGTHRATDQSTWQYSPLDANGVPIGRNNCLQVLWYLLGWRVAHQGTGELILTCGRGVDVSDINMASFITGANNCEVAGYYTDCILSTENAHTSNEDSLTSNGLIGQVIDPGGLWSYYANVDDTANVAITLTDDDILQGSSVQWNDFEPMSNQFAQVVGKFVDPSIVALYQDRAYPIVRDATYEANLGVKIRVTQDFSNIQDALLAQKLARLKLNAAQFQGVFKASFLYRAMKAQVWDVVIYQSDRFGWTKTFRIYSHIIEPQAGLQLELREIHPSIWSAGSVTIPMAPGIGAKYDPRQQVAATGLVAYAYTSTAGTDGTIIDGMLLDWDDAPQNVRRTEIQFKQTSKSYWESLPYLNQDTSILAVGYLLSGATYSARIRHITINEVEGPWLNLAPDFTVGSASNVKASDIQVAAGTAVWSNITGANKPSDNADVTAAHIAAAIAGQAATATSSDYQSITGPSRPEIYGSVGDNLIRNASLLLGSTAFWTMVNTLSYQSQYGDPCNFFRSTTDNGYVSYDKTPTNNFKRFFVSFWKRSSEANKQITFNLNFYDYAGTFIINIVNTSNVGAVNVWTKYSFQFDVPINAVFFSFQTTLSVAAGQLHDIGGIRISGTEEKASYGADVSYNIFDSGTAVVRTNLLTNLGVASAIAGQGAFATLASGTSLDNSVYGMPSRLGSYGGFLSAGQMNYQNSGGGTIESLRPAELGSNVTETRISSAFTGQGAFATLSSASYGSSYLTGFGALAPRSRINLGDGYIYRNDGTTSLSDNLVITSLGTAANITGQAATATSSDFSVLTGSTKPQNNADVTANSQILATIGTTVTVPANYQGVIAAGTLPERPIDPVVTLGGVDKTHDNATTYSIINAMSGCVGNITVDNTAGSATKGRQLVGTGLTSSGTYQLQVSYNGVNLPAVTVAVTVVIGAAPTSSGAGGTTGTFDLTGGTVGSGGFAQTGIVSGITLASGKTIHAYFTGDYDYPGTVGSRSVQAKWQYSPAGANNWTDFAAYVQGTAAAGDYGSSGSVTCNQDAASLAAGNYDVRFMTNLSNTGSVRWSSGSGSVSIS
jgi:hypothetical protein